MGATQSTSSPYVLETARGKLRGIEAKDLNGRPVLQRYSRIPYAQPPTGKLRFRRPQPLDSEWSFSSKSGEAGDHTSFGPICPQPEYGHSAALLENPAAAPEIENVQSEDCLYLNIWVPAGTPPPSGWPVQFFIHGGWLQIGDANQDNSHDPFDLLAHSTPRIIVAPTYRLNIFGFLAGKELQEAESNEPTPGNYGLWDQRAALEWVHANIKLFKGDPSLITIGGLSAGSHSALLQLYHDTYQPASKRVLKQIFLWSNAIAIQPNPTTSDALTAQYKDLLSVLNISSTATKPSEALAALREVPSNRIVDVIFKLKLHTARTSTDNDFVPSNFLKTIHDGSFTSRLAENQIRIVLGEVCDEALLYKLVNPPSTYAGLVRQMENYYPKAVVEKLLTLNEIYDIPRPDETGPEAEERFKDVFASIVADMQVHASLRGFTKSLLAPPRSESSGKVPEVLRYRIAWRAKGLDDYIDPAVGVCHAADAPIWWLSGYRSGFDEEDKKRAEEFLQPFGDFLQGKQWNRGIANNPGINGAKRIARYIDPQGVTHVDVEDKLWEKGIKVWDAVAEV